MTTKGFKPGAQRWELNTLPVVLQVVVLHCKLVKTYLSLTKVQFNGKKENALKTFGRQKLEQLRFLNQAKLRCVQEIATPVSSCLTTFCKIQHRKIEVNQTQSVSDSTNSLAMSAVALSCSCANNEALTVSPKDPTPRRKSSFLGQSLRFVNGNHFALFE